MEARAEQDNRCVSVASQYADITLPIRAKPCAEVLGVETDCCGEPEATVRPASGGCCEVSFTQSVRIRIRIRYGAEVETGKPAFVCAPAPDGEHRTKE